MFERAIAAAGVLGLLLMPPVSQATNGYFSHGYGVKSKAQAGVGIALPEDALTIATNPAGLVDVADGFEAGLDVFAPRRGATVVQGSSSVSYAANATGAFYIPEFGYSRHLNADLAVGIALFGNGGMNTDYSSNPFQSFGATGPAGVDLFQAFIAPAVAWRINARHSIGAAVDLTYQRFKAEGIGIFAGFSSDPAHLSDNGYDSSTGWGVHLGWTGRVSDHVTLGATWRSKISMGKFDKYRGLFADGGDFDIPETYGFGVALHATPRVNVALDWQRILYSEIPAVGNSISSLFSGVLLGAPNGPGFGWKDVSVWKLGANYAITEALTLRTGFSDSNQPVPAAENFFNTLSPGVVEKHFTLGATWKVGKGAISASYLHAFEETAAGSGSIPPAFGGGEIDVRLEENSFGLSYSYEF